MGEELQGGERGSEIGRDDENLGVLEQIGGWCFQAKHVRGVGEGVSGGGWSRARRGEDEGERGAGG